jgi:hypothetical protein
VRKDMMMAEGSDNGVQVNPLQSGAGLSLGELYRDNPEVGVDREGEYPDMRPSLYSEKMFGPHGPRSDVPPETATCWESMTFDNFQQSVSDGYKAVSDSCYQQFHEPEPGVVKAVFNEDLAFYPVIQDKVLTYRPDQVRSFIAPFYSSDLTACHGWQIWFIHVGFLMYAIFLMIFLAETSYPDGEIGEGGSCGTAAAPRNMEMCQLNKLLEAAKQEFRFLIAFILAAYVGVALSKWNDRRTNFAKLCGRVRNLNILIQSSLSRIPSKNLNDNHPRALLIRWLLLGYELCILKARGHMDSDKGQEYLTKKGILHKGEWNAMVKGDRHTSCFYWMNKLVNELKAKGELEEGLATHIILEITESRAVANDLMSNVDRDQPFSYTALCGVLVKINVVIMSTWKGVEWSVWLHNFGYGELPNQPKFWVDMLVLFCWNVSYVAMYDLGYMLFNPFGNRRIDIPVETITSGLYKLSTTLIDENISLPPALSKKKV